MVFNSESNNDDIVSDAKFWCGLSTSDTTTYPNADIARDSNRGLDRVHALILKSDGRWKYDDTNNSSTTVLDVTTNLLSGTQKYALAVTWLKINQVRIKDSAGNWVTLAPMPRKQQSDAQLTATSGTPSGYFLLGNWIYLDKAPNYASSGGLEVQHQRGPSYFTPTDTTKTPGFASHFHRLISLYAALDYCEVNDLSKRAASIRNKIGFPPTGNNPGAGLEGELCTHYSERNEDEQPTISFAKEDYGQSMLGNDSRVSSGSNRFF